jgi:hypothetical protein
MPPRQLIPKFLNPQECATHTFDVRPPTYPVWRTGFGPGLSPRMVRETYPRTWAICIACGSSRWLYASDLHRAAGGW